MSMTICMFCGATLDTGDSNSCQSCNEKVKRLLRANISIADVETMRTELTSLRQRNTQLEDGCKRLTWALSEIDCAMLPPEQIEQDTKAVGGPVSMYDVTYDEKAVVQRVQKLVTQQQNLSRQLVDIILGCDFEKDGKRYRYQIVPVEHNTPIDTYDEKDEFWEGPDRIEEGDR